MQRLIKIIFDIAHWGRKWYWRTFNIKTQGARIMIIDNQKVFLVKHRYGSLWVFPGGGAKKNEDLKEVAIREAFEETGIIVKTIKQKLGTYHNTHEGKDDTITIFVTTDWKIGGGHNIFEKFMKIFEIKESGWFDLHNLPENTSIASKRRVKEYLNNPVVEYIERW